MTSIIQLAAPMIGPKSLRVMASLLLSALASGCASLKEMTASFDHHWDNPQSIMADTKQGDDKERALDKPVISPDTADLGVCGEFARPGDSNQGENENRALTRQLAECLLQHAKNLEAKKYFAALAENGDDALALQGLGVAELRLNDVASAQTDLEHATELDPSLWRAWNALGVAYDQTNRADDAQAAYLQASQLNPSESAPLNNLGISYLKAGRFESAIAAFKEAVSKGGADGASETNLRFAYAMAGDYERAVKSLPDSERAAALNNAGFAAAMRGDKVEARRLFKQALDESPTFYAKSYNNMTLLLD